jgi:hypothetical protein
MELAAVAPLEVMVSPFSAANVSTTFPGEGARIPNRPSTGRT